MLHARAVGSGSDGGDDTTVGTLAVNNNVTIVNKLYFSDTTVDFGLLQEGHVLAPRIYRSFRFLHFDDFLFKNVFYATFHFVKAAGSSGLRLDCVLWVLSICLII